MISSADSANTLGASLLHYSDDYSFFSSFFFSCLYGCLFGCVIFCLSFFSVLVAVAVSYMILGSLYVITLVMISIKPPTDTNNAKVVPRLVASPSVNYDPSLSDIVPFVLSVLAAVENTNTIDGFLIVVMAFYKYITDNKYTLFAHIIFGLLFWYHLPFLKFPPIGF
jgi:hypothetical protein